MPWHLHAFFGFKATRLGGWGGRLGGGSPGGGGCCWRALWPGIADRLVHHNRWLNRLDHYGIPRWGSFAFNLLLAPSVCLFVGLSVCRSVGRPSGCLSVCLSVCRSSSVRRSSCLSVWGFSGTDVPDHLGRRSKTRVNVTVKLIVFRACLRKHL